MPIDPIRNFELKGQVSTLLSAVLFLTPGANRVLVTGITGKRIRVMGWSAMGTTATAGYFTIRTETAASTLIAFVGAPPSTGGICEKSPIVDCGYGESLTGDGIWSEVTTADIGVSIYYITYTP